MLRFSLPAMAVSVILMSANQASAQEVYVFGSIGTTETTHEVERNLGPNPPMLPVEDASATTSTQESGISLIGGVGVEQHLGSSGAFIGVEGYYAFEDTQSRNISGVLVTDLELESRYGGRLRFGYDITDDFSVYTHSGISWLDYDITQSYTFAPPVTERSDTESVFTYGAGFTYDLTDNISIVVDYTDSDEADFLSIPEVAGNTGRENPSTLSARTFSSGLRFRF